MKNFAEESIIENASDIKVLCVEEDSEIRLTLSHFLKEYFGKVVSTAYADNAIKLFDSGFFDLIICDTDLPDMDAKSFCSKIKHIAPRKPIVLISKNKDIDKLIKLVNIGISGYIQTPLNQKELISVLSRVVNEITDMKMMYRYQDDIEKIEYEDGKQEQEQEQEPEDQSMELLLKKYDTPISAQDFMERYPINIFNTVDNILLINEDLDLHLNTFIRNPSKKNADILADELNRFSILLDGISEFSNIAFIVNKLSIVFNSLDPDRSYKEYENVFIAISSSLSQWFEDIFIDKTAEDIHFLDQSLLADAMTLENLFREDVQSDRDSIEFF